MIDEQLKCTVVFDDVDGVLSKMYVTGENPEAVRGILRSVASVLTYYDKSKKFTWAVKHGYDDCTVRFFDGRAHTMPIGLIPRVTRYIRKTYGERVTVKITQAIREMYTPPHGKIPPERIAAFAEGLHMYNKGEYLDALEEGKDVKKENFALTLRPHQLKIAEEALNRRRVSILACTSAGKSMSIMVIARYLMERENRKVLIIVPNAALVEQIYENFWKDYGWEEAESFCTLIHGKSKDKLPKKKIEELKRLSIGEELTLKKLTISTWQSLRLKSDSFFTVFDAVLVDEAHSAKGEELRDILAKCKNANNFKVGFSGTIPDAELGENTDGDSNHIDAGLIEGGLGPKVDVVRLHELIAQGILTPLEVKSIFIPYPMQLRPAICASATKYEVERGIVTENSSRKDVISMLFGSRITTDQNTVILFNFKEHLHEFTDFMKENFPQFTYHIVEGDIDAVERNEISHKVEKSTANVIVATYGCMKQGVNIKLLHNLVMAEPTKSSYSVIQSMGRIVRKHPAKKVATVYDLVDDATYYTNPRNGGPGNIKYNYMVRHYYERVKYYAAEFLPIEEVHLDGVYEAKVTPDDIKSRRDKAAKSAEESQAKKKSSKKKAEKPDQYGGRTLFTR